LRFKAAEKYRETEGKKKLTIFMRKEQKGSEMSGKQQSRFSFVSKV
jgi:hypothetical protein